MQKKRGSSQSLLTDARLFQEAFPPQPPLRAPSCHRHLEVELGLPPELLTVAVGG